MLFMFQPENLLTEVMQQCFKNSTNIFFKMTLSSAFAECKLISRKIKYDKLKCSSPGESLFQTLIYQSIESKPLEYYFSFLLVLNLLFNISTTHVKLEILKTKSSGKTECDTLSGNKACPCVPTSALRFHAVS